MSKETHTNPFWNEHYMGLKGTKLPWLDPEVIMANYRRNVDLMNTTQQIAAETTKAVMQLQAQYIKDVFEQFSEQTKRNMSASSPEEKATRQTETTKETFDQTIDHARTLNAIIAKSGEKIMENVQKHLKESLDDSAAAVKKTKTKL